jgi:hypothetical protein
MADTVHVQEQLHTVHVRPPRGLVEAPVCQQQGRVRSACGKRLFTLN